MSKNITLQIRIPSKVAISILGRLYGGGYITKEQYRRKIKQIDSVFLKNEEKKIEKMDKILSKTRRFWGK